MTKRTIALLLAVLTVVSLLAACATSAPASTSAASTAAASSSAPASTKAAPMEITWLGWNVNNIAKVQDNPMQKYLEEK